MKKYNKKQLAWAAKKVQGYKSKMFLGMFSIVMLLFCITATAFTVVDPTSATAAIQMGGASLILITMANIGNIEQPSGRETSANQIGFRLWLIAREQINSGVPFPTPNANREIGDIPLKAGEYMHYFEGIENSLKYTGTGEQGDISPTFGKTIPIYIKYSNAALNFVEEYTQKGFVLIWSTCESSDKEIVGSFCKPVILQSFEVKNDGDGKYVSLTFGNTHWRQPLIYKGSIISEEAAVVAAGAIDLAISSNNNYRLSDGATPVTLATVSGITSADYGRIITILAPAIVATPVKIADNTVFILVDGEQWEGKAGSRIAFQILDDTTLVEVSRTQS